MFYYLCNMCKTRHSTNKNVKLTKNPSDCYICHGKSSLIEKLCDEALGLSVQYQWGSFSISTTFEKKLLAREDNLFDDESVGDAFAIKNHVNNLAIAYVKKKTKKQPSSNADLSLKLDFKQERGKVNSSSIYILGHYLKKSRNYCQHDWACSSCHGKGCKKCNYQKSNYPSIETVMRESFLPAFAASSAKFHASGREDVDVMAIGTGRPFVVELINPKKRTADLRQISDKIRDNSPIEALGLKYCKRTWIGSVCTSHFDKHYRAIISSEKKLSKKDFDILKSKIPMHLRQKTPIRVLRRRADIMRYRTVYDISLVEVINSKLIVDIWAEAGTYIKELIHSDKNRTNPSISSILGAQCQCDQLDVIKIDDWFLDTIAT